MEAPKPKRLPVIRPRDRCVIGHATTERGARNVLSKSGFRAKSMRKRDWRGRLVWELGPC